MFRRLFLALALALTVSAAWAQDVEDAIAAFGAGDYATARTIAEPLAQQGVARATNLLGVLHQNGFGMPRDIDHAIALFEAAGQGGFTDAYINLANLYEDGAEGIAPDLDRVELYLSRAIALDGHGPATYRLGTLLERREVQDWPRILSLYRGAAAEGSSPAMARLAELHVQGTGVPRDLGIARYWAEQSAATGSPGGLQLLGRYHEEGLGGPRDIATAVEYYIAAAEAGSGSAANDVGILFEEGMVGGRPDLPRAFTWYMRGVELGDIFAHRNAADLLLDGDARVPDDPARAADLLRAAAEAGDAHSMTQLGRLLRGGDLGYRDFVESRRFTETAALEHNDALAYYDLAQMTALGAAGIPADLAEAVSLLERSIAAGSILSAWTLHELLALPSTPETHDPVRALAWCLWARQHDSWEERRQAYLDNSCTPLIARMTPAEREAAEDVAADLLDRYRGRDLTASE
ncbi:hypothetical protein HKCCE2091_05255 [Rhodobacterales bacterium HKCCE2091]|nr:hypothetical protein [Rhodobacterales bacterium HKCCE2091]